jgi:serine/threonine-protein kinase RIO1
MFPECRLLHEELNEFNIIAVKETCVIIVAKIVWIGYTIVTHFAGYLRVDAQCTGHFVPRFEYSVGRSEVADGCHRRVSGKLVDRSSAQVVLDAPVLQSILLLARKQ